MSSEHGSLLILGGTSDIGGELARQLCPGRTVYVGARRASSLKDITEQLRTHGAQTVHTFEFDAQDIADLCSKTAELPGPIRYAVVCFGILGQQSQAEVDPLHAEEIAHIDYTAQIAALTALASRMERQGSAGTLVAFSSIAGWRARKANYVYGSTKSGLDAFCQGLSDRLHGGPLQLIVARPGFVIGSMTEGMKPAPLSVRPKDVADAIVEATKKNHRSTTLWIPRRLRFLAWVMRLVPRPIWRHMPR